MSSFGADWVKEGAIPEWDEILHTHQKRYKKSIKKNFKAWNLMKKLIRSRIGQKKSHSWLIWNLNYLSEKICKIHWKGSKSPIFKVKTHLESKTKSIDWNMRRTNEESMRSQWGVKWVKWGVKWVKWGVKWVNEESNEESFESNQESNESIRS